VLKEAWVVQTHKVNSGVLEVLDQFSSVIMEHLPQLIWCLVPSQQAMLDIFQVEVETSNVVVERFVTFRNVGFQ
jgi:hypothetical protein